MKIPYTTETTKDGWEISMKPLAKPVNIKREWIEEDMKRKNQSIDETLRFWTDAAIANIHWEASKNIGLGSFHNRFVDLIGDIMFAESKEDKIKGLKYLREHIDTFCLDHQYTVWSD